MQQGSKASSLFRVRPFTGLYPHSVTGVPGLNYLLALSFFQLGGPFGFCAFTWLTPIQPGSLEIALKRTRPRPRFCYLIGLDYMPDGKIVKVKTPFVKTSQFWV
jgi:hypothetical protein